jgi:hypothetical protein
MTQLAFPADVSATEIARKATLGGAIDLCLQVGGLEPKQVQADLKLDKAQYSRWTSGQEGIIYPKLSAVMDLAGNDVPLLWMLHDRGYDLGSVHKRENELQRDNRRLREQNAALILALKGGNP